MTSSNLIKILKKLGWYEVSQRGSHIKFQHKTKGGNIIVAHHKGKDIPIGTLKAILKQAGIE